MSNFNKVVTNIPVSLTETEMSNLSQTFSGIIQGGGGGGEGKRYIGDGVYVTVNNDANPGVISLTQTSLDKLNKEIPSAVSSFPDSVQYAKKTYVDSTFQTKSDMSAYATTAYVNGATSAIYYTNILGLVDALNAKQDTLTFGYDETDAISSINSHKLAGAGGVTGDYYSASNPSGFINSTQAETQILAKNYITSGVSQLDNFYSKTDTSSRTEIANAFDNIPKYILNGDSNITATSAQDGKNVRWDLAVNAKPVVTDTTLTGENGIYTHTTTKSGEWCVELVQSAYAAINDVQNKLDTTVAAQTYQPIGNYLSSNALEGYATTALLDTISSKIESDIPTTVAQLTDSGNYYKKTETSSKNQLTTEFAKYQPTGNYLVADDITGKLDKSIYANASGNWENTYNVVNQYSAAGTWLTEHQSLTNYYTKSETSGTEQLSTEFGKYLTTAQYNTDSATFALKTDLNDLVSSASVTSTETDYVMTTTGWKVLTLPGGGMTQVIHDDTLTGQGNADNSKLGVVWSALSGNTIYSAIKANSASAAKRLQDSTAGPSIQVGDVTALQHWASSNSSTWEGVTAKLGTAQYALDSATFVTKPDTTQTVLNNNYLIYSTLTDPTATTGWMPLSANYYSKTEADGRYQKKNEMGSYLTTAQYETDSATFVTSSNASISAAGEQYALTTTGWAKVQGGGGSTVTIDTTNNEIKDGTSAVSAMSYVVNPNNTYWKPQKSCVCTEAEINTMAGYANGQGMLFFVVSGHNQ